MLIEKWIPVFALYALEKGNVSTLSTDGFLHQFNCFCCFAHIVHTKNGRTVHERNCV